MAASTDTQPKVLHDAIWWDKGNQDLRGERIVSVDDRKLRAKIRRNAYDHQSWAFVEIWSETTVSWSKLFDLPVADLDIQEYSWVSPERDVEWSKAMDRSLGDLIDRGIVVSA